VRDEGLDGSKVHDGLRLDALTEGAPEHATKEGAATRVDAHDFPPSINLGDFNLIRDYQAAAHQVNEVAGEQVFGEQELTGAALEAPKVDALTLKRHAPFVETTDFADGHEGITPFDFDHRTNNRRVGIVTETRD
jgi:hypothetical protein